LHIHRYRSGASLSAQPIPGSGYPLQVRHKAIAQKPSAGFTFGEKSSAAIPHAGKPVIEQISIVNRVINMNLSISVLLQGVARSKIPVLLIHTAKTPARQYKGDCSNNLIIT
jgi:hypothetical protein